MALRRRGTDQAAEDTRTVARVRGALEGYAQAGPGAAVSVAHVLDLLNPRGLWSLDPEHRKAAKAAETAPGQPHPGERDPVTGCLPVTPPQT